MSNITADMQRELDGFNKKHRQTLEKAAKVFAEKMIIKIHFGIDFVNDESDIADYAVIEYLDGRMEEQDAWLEELDSEVFMWDLPSSHAYTFNIADIQVEFDLQGGTMDTEEMVARAYHNNSQRHQFIKAEAEKAKYQYFVFEHYETIEEIAEALQEKGITEIYFGINKIGDGYELANWGKLVKKDGEVWLEKFPPELEDLRQDLQNNFYDYGAFIFDAIDERIFANSTGGLLILPNGDEHAYADQQHLASLRKKFGVEE